MKIRRHGAEEGEYVYPLKVRGITLSEDVVNKQGLHYETFKERVIKYAKTGEIDPIPLHYPKFLRASVLHGSVFSAPMSKIYKPYVGNGIVCSTDFTVKPFG